MHTRQGVGSREILPHRFRKYILLQYVFAALPRYGGCVGVVVAKGLRVAGRTTWFAWLRLHKTPLTIPFFEHPSPITSQLDQVFQRPIQCPTEALRSGTPLGLEESGILHPLPRQWTLSTT